MTAEFECPECGESLTHERESMLVGKVKRHADREHNMTLEEDNIKQGIK